MKIIQLLDKANNDMRLRNLCDKCGSDVHYAFTKDGNKYVADSARNSVHGGTFSPAHRCDLWNKDDLAFLSIPMHIKNNQIITGQDVEVIKGRKVPVGSKGKIFWIGNKGYGFVVGIELSNNEKVFTSINNIKVGA